MRFLLLGWARVDSALVDLTPAGSIVIESAASQITMRGRVVVAVAAVVGVAAAGCTVTPTYDYVMLVQQWPVVDCTTAPACLPTDQYFTVHGGSQ